VTGENNAAVLLVRALGPTVLPEARARASALSGEGRASPGLAPFVEWDVFVGAREKEAGAAWRELPWARATTPWKAEEDAELSAWVDENGEALRWAEAASRRERCFWGVMTLRRDGPLFAMVEPSFWPVRQLVECIQFRAMRSLGAGDGVAAWDDLRTCHRLARLIAQEPTVLGRCVGMGMEEIALKGDLRVIVTEGSAEKLAAMEREVEELTAMPTLGEALDVTERFEWLDLLTMLAREGVGEMRRRVYGDYDPVWRGDPFGSLDPFPVHYDAAMRRVNELFDRTVAAERAGSYTDRKAGREALRAEAAEVCARYERMSACLWSVEWRLMGRFHPYENFFAGDRWEEVEQRRVMAAAGVTLAKFRVERGMFPSRLSEVGKFLDRFTGEELVYRRGADGVRYTLYSRGLNTVDDRGVTRRKQGDVADDLVQTEAGMVESVGPRVSSVRLD
jgi:hypothetical protein